MSFPNVLPFACRSVKMYDAEREWPVLAFTFRGGKDAEGTDDEVRVFSGRGGGVADVGKRESVWRVLPRPILRERHQNYRREVVEGRTHSSSLFLNI